jgi:drug/metabolite transporter (DMT)-like permease
MAAASLGTADFAGGLAARSRNAIQVAVTVQAVELALLIVAVLMLRPALPPTGAIAIGGAAGLAGAVGLASLYRGLSAGSMGVVAAISGVGSVAIPIVVGLIVLGSVPSAPQAIGVACAIAATLAASMMRGKGIQGRSIGYGLLAAAGFGTYLLLINAGAAWGIWVLLVSRISAVLGLGAANIVQQTGTFGVERLAVGAGVLDLAGNGLVIAALQALPVGIVAAISGTYPVVTSLLAWGLLHQHPRLGGWASVGLALVGIVLMGQGG